MEKWTPHNRVRLSPEQLGRLIPQLQARYMAYEEVPKPIADVLDEVRKRLAARKRRENQLLHAVSKEAREEWLKTMVVMGHLKAAEASHRISNIRLQLHARRKLDRSRLIEVQPLALRALRLDALLKPPPDNEDNDVRYKIDKETVLNIWT